MLALLTFWTEFFFVVEDCPAHCRMFRSILDLYLLDDDSTPSPAVTTKSISVDKCPLGGSESP